MNDYDTARALLVPIWRGVPAAYKSRYRRNIWQQFEDNIKSAAYTSTLSKFVNNLCQHLQVSIRGEDVAAVEAIIRSGKDRELLHLLRDEATTCVLMVRVENEARQEEWKVREAERQSEDKLVSSWLFEKED